MENLWSYQQRALNSLTKMVQLKRRMILGENVRIAECSKRSTEKGERLKPGSFVVNLQRWQLQAFLSTLTQLSHRFRKTSLPCTSTRFGKTHRKGRKKKRVERTRRIRVGSLSHSFRKRPRRQQHQLPRPPLLMNLSRRG